MNEVFVVTEGTYSNYGICAIFSTRPLAEAFVEKFVDDYDDAEIEVWPLDVINAKEKNLYHIRMLRSGDIVEIHTNAYGGPPTMDGGTDTYTAKPWRRFGLDGVELIFYTSVITETQEKAIKIANERRTRFIADGKWEDGGD